MYTYINEDLIRIVNEKVTATGLDSKHGLRVISRIALMIKKFENHCLENYKNSIDYLYDRDEAFLQLKQEQANPRLSLLDRLANIVYFIRKFEIDLLEIKTVSTDFLKTNVKWLKSAENQKEANFETSFLLSLSLKYLCRNTKTIMNIASFLTHQDVLELISASNDDKVKIELVWTLGFILESISNSDESDKSKSKYINEILGTKTQDEINSLIVNNGNISDESKAYLLSQIEAIKNCISGINPHGYSADFESKNPTTIINTKKELKNKKQLVVSKTIETVKSTTKNLSSDDVQLKLLNLANALKNRSRMTKTNVTIEHFDTVNDTSGDDRSMFRSTWAETLNLYNKCLGGQVLKQDDKDEYLPSKLFGYLYYKCNAPSIRWLYDFYINRMIANIFKRISKTQKLNEKTIDTLLKGITGLKTLTELSSSRYAISSMEKHLSSLSEFNTYVVKAIRENHKEFESLDGPNILTEFFSDLEGKLLQEETKKTWYGRSYTEKVVRTSYEEGYVNNMIRKEIVQLRIDIVQALYQSTCRDRTIMNKSERMKKITDYLENKQDDELDADEEEFRDRLFQIIELVDESNSGLDYKKLFNTYMNALTTNKSVKSAVNFMLGQIRDPKRCKELITDEVLDKFFSLIKSASTLDSQKCHLLEIVNSYLEQPFTDNSLSEKHLDELISDVIMRNQTNDALIDAALMSISLSANKTHSLPDEIITKLIEHLNEPYGNFIVLILSSCENSLLKKEHDLEMLSYKLDSDCVVVEQENVMVKIERRNRSNKGCISIAQLAIQLLMKAFDGQKSMVTKLSKRTFENLMRAIECCDDKDVRAIVAKCIYLISTTSSSVYEFSVESLMTLSSLINSEDFQTRVYINTAYVRSLARFSASTKDQPLKNDFIESMTSIFVRQGTMKISEKDFVPEINNHVLEIFLTETRKLNKKRIDNEEIFQIMEEILHKNDNISYSLKVLQIIEAYTTPFRVDSSIKSKTIKYDHFKIPESTIQALENAFSFVDLADEALFCLQNVIYNGQAVSNRILQIFVDNIQSSPNSRRRLRAFKLLNKARLNQDISNEAFYRFELVKAAYGLTRNVDYFSNNKFKQSMLKFIKNRSEKDDIPMPIDVMIALERHLDEQIVLDILSDVSRNRQILNNDIINKLVNKLDVDVAKINKTVNQRIVEIFDNLSRNNQTLSDKLMKKLQLTLETLDTQNNDENLKMRILSIFLQIIQKGEKVSEKIIERILNLIGKDQTSNITFKQELLSSIGAIVMQSNETELDSYKSKIQSVLIECITSNNLNTQKICLNGWSALIKKTQIETDCLSTLIDICTDNRSSNKCDHTIRGSILKLLEDYINKQSGLFNPKLRSKLELARMTTIDNEEILIEKLNSQMKSMNGQINLLDQNYSQLAKILNKQSPNSLKAKEQVLKLLDNYENKSDINEELLESIALVFESSNSKEAKETCLKLLSARNRKSTSPRVNKILKYKQDKDNMDMFKKQFISSSIPLKLILKDQLRLRNEQINEIIELLQITDKDELIKIQNIDQFIEILIKNNPKGSNDLFENSVFVFVIEQSLISNNHKDLESLSKRTLSCYSRIIRLGKFQNLESVVETLSIYINRLTKDNDLLVIFIECLFLSVGTLATHNVSLTVEVLKLFEDLLEHECGQVRALAFAGLSLTSNRFESKYFQTWCQQKLDTITEKTNIVFTDNQRIDILYVLVILKYVDLDVFKNNKNRNVWHRELLISNLFKLLETSSDFDKQDFYEQWLQFEDKQSIKSIALLVHITLNVTIFKSLNEITETLFVLNNSNLAATDLNIHQLNIEDMSNLIKKDFKQDWSVCLIESALQDKDAFDKTFIEKLARNVTEKFKASFIKKLFKSIEIIDDLKAFESLLEFCSTAMSVNHKPEDVLLSDVHCKNVSELKSLLQVKQLCDNIATSSTDKDQVRILFGLLLDLIQKKREEEFEEGSSWTFEQLNEFIKCIKQNQSKRMASQLTIDLLRIISYYGLSPMKYDECLKIFKTQEPLKYLNILVVENKFNQKSMLKSSAELMHEIRQENQISDETIAELENQLQMIKSNTLRSTLSDLKEINLTNLPISQWDPKYIKKWASHMKTSKNEKFNIVEAIAVVKRAVYLNNNFNLTDVQILVSLISLNESHADTQNMKGKLLQVATGEGKSIIVVILAIVNALREGSRGSKTQVDVITSSPVLAERDAKDKMRLYRMFALKCNFNNDTIAYVKGAKDCYKADIVYGEVSQFQFDCLRDNYCQLGTLSDRECSVAIVDEVDAMLIDDSSKIARLSSIGAGMDLFQPIYVFLWNKLIDVQKRFIMFDSKMYLINGHVQFENGKVTMEYADAQGEIIKVLDLEDYLKKHDSKLDSSIAQRINGDIDEYLTKTLTEYVENLDQEQIVKIPQNFRKFFETQRSKWILNAIEALNYQENVHYVVSDGQIKPVDYFSTGIVQSATSWSGGLHQFLQLKHNLKMTCETFTTNFLSNIGFIGTYKSLYGLTGTLGSKKARQVLKEVYKVDMINMPQSRKKQYVEFPAVVSPNENKWFQDICSATLVETRKERGVLIICETIEQANGLNERLRARYRPSAIKLYTMNNMNQERHIEKMMSGDVVIATNLAGRGTDIHTSDIEKWGGMHVIVTFMPQNQRVQDQAFGRTARQGKLGTGQMILNMRQLGASYENVNPKEVKNKRDMIESDQLDIFQNTELKLIQTKDELFSKFCLFYNETIRTELRESVSKSIWKNLKERFSQTTPTVYETNVLSAIEEKWAMFLRDIDDKRIPIEQADKECNELIKQLNNDFKQNRVIENMYYHIIIGNDYMVNESNATKAKQHYTKALQEKEFKELYGSAHVGLVWSSIVLEKQKTSNQKHFLIDALKKALEILSNEMALLNSSQSMLQNASFSSGTRFSHSDLDKQLNVKTTILGSYLNSVQQSMRVINKSLRLFDLVRICQDTGISEIYQDIDREFNMDKIKWDNQESTDEKPKKILYNLTFNDLTVYSDMGSQDQACNTIDKAFSNSKISNLSLLGSKYVSSKYNGLGIKINQIGLSQLRNLLNQDKEFEQELSAQSAIAQLKQERTYFNAMELTSSFNADLTIIYPDSKKETKSNVQINTAIELIETKMIQNNELRYNITIKKANENGINKLFHNNPSSKPSSDFQISFDNLDEKSFTKLAHLLSSEKTKVQINMLISNEHILPLLINKNNEKNKLDCKEYSFSICSEEKRKYQSVSLSELKQKVDDPKSDTKLIEIKVDISSTRYAKEFVTLFHDSLFNVSFSDVGFDQIWALLNDQQEIERTASTFTFDRLNRDVCKMFIEVLREKYIEFSIIFAELTQKQAKHIIDSADLGQEVLEITKVRPLVELFMNSQLPHVELAELAARGIEYTFDLSEKRFIPWRSICTVALIGTLQIVGGGLLIATGFGATVGMSLISEGISDMLYAYRAYSSRQFDWVDYGKQKAISIAISVASMGLSKFKDAGKGISSVVSGEAKTLATEAAKEATEAAATQLTTNAKTIGKEMLKTGKNLKVLAVKFTGVKVGEAVVREGMNSGVQYLTNLSMDSLKPRISMEIQQKVQSRFCDVRLEHYLKKIYALDAVTKSKSLETQVLKIVSDSINPESSFMRKQWDSVAMPLLKGILGTSEKYGSAISLGIRIAGTLHGLYSIQAIIDNVQQNLIKKLAQIDEDTLTTNLVLEKNVKIEKEEARLISKELHDKGFDVASIVKNNSSTKASNLKAQISQYKHNEVAQFLTNFIDELSALENSYIDSLNVIIKSVSDRITEQIIRIIDSQLVSPWSTYAVSSLTDSISKRVQHYCIVDKDQNSSSLDADEEKFEALKKRKEAGEKLTEDEKNFMSGFGAYRTVGQQVNYNSQAYCLDYSQYAIKYYSSNQKETNTISKETRELADEVRKNKPATITEMNVLAKKLGLNLVMTSDPDFVPTPEQIAQGVKVIFIQNAEKDDNGVDQVGHAYFVDENGNKQHVNSKPNDCFYAVVSKILETQGIEKSHNELRQITASGIESNGNMDKALESEKWIRERYPFETNTLLFSAGIIRQGSNLAVEDKDVDDLIKSINSQDKKDLRGGEYGNQMKEKIKEDPEKGSYIVEIDGQDRVVNDKVTLHHVIPDHMLENMVRAFKDPNTGQYDKQGLKDAMQNYINKEHIKPLVENAIDNRITGLNDGQILHASISHNPHNLIAGPAPSNDKQNPQPYRTDDSKNKLDQKVLNWQDDDYKDKVKNVYDDVNKQGKGTSKSAIDNYGDIPKSKPVKFEPTPHDPNPDGPNPQYKVKKVN